MIAQSGSTYFRLVLVAKSFVNFCCNIFLMVLPGLTQLTRKFPIALRLILRDSPGPTA